jgi:hypothetical protein
MASKALFESERIMTGGKLFFLSSFNFINFKADFIASNSDVNTEVYDGSFS